MISLYFVLFCSINSSLKLIAHSKAYHIGNIVKIDINIYGLAVPVLL